MESGFVSSLLSFVYGTKVGICNFRLAAVFLRSAVLFQPVLGVGRYGRREGCVAMPAAVLPQRDSAAGGRAEWLPRNSGRLSDTAAEAPFYCIRIL